jgi:hypothetical protein
MSRKPSEKEPVRERGGEQEKEQQKHHRQGEPLGQKRDQTSQKKKTVQFDEGQKFTSDEDLKRRSA